MAGVTVRRCVAADAEALAAMYASDREGTRAAGPDRPESFFTPAGQRERITVTWPRYHCIGFVAEVDGRVVGLVLFEDIAEGSTTVGYFVSPPARGRGVATAALGSVVQLARDELGLQQLVAEIDASNAASLRVVERNGFRRDGTALVDGIELERLVLDLEPSAGAR